jgi:multisubunit Na+/H+ antiporter MnhB subunit
VNVAEFLALSVVAVACVVIFLVMRYPQLRRPQFRGSRAFSTGAALAAALGVFVVFSLLVFWLQD